MFLPACGKREPAANKDVVAYVNEEPVFTSELQEKLKIKERLDPVFKITKDVKQQQLDLIIDQKIMIQEAIEQGLAREDRFVNSIKAYWEQTLIRDFIDYKTKQFKSVLSVSDEEINDFYGHLSSRVTFHVLASHDQEFIDEAIKNPKANIEQSSWEVIGPISYDEITSPVLFQAFDKELGKIHQFHYGPQHYLVSVLDRKEVVLKPLEEIKEEVKKRVLALKTRQQFDQWLKSKREHSQVSIIVH